MICEKAVVFPSIGEELVGILHQPQQIKDIGVLMVVGGPQYRVGSHRQFVTLARFLAKNGFPVFRFDYRGMGDSSGAMQDFEQVGSDIKDAVDAFFEQNTSLKQVVLWGLCDAASAIGFYAPSDERVTGLVLLNPWVRTEQGESKAFIKDYYLKRFLSRGFWKKILAGKVNFKSTFISLFGKVAGVFKTAETVADGECLPLPERVLNSFSAFNKEELFILSGNDLTAKEFINLVNTNAKGKALMKRTNVSRVDLKESDHTFSKKIWKDKVNEATLTWLQSL